MAFERGIPRIEAPRPQQPPRRCLGVEVGEALAGQPHEFPAPSPRPSGHHRRRARRIAELPVERIPDAPLERHEVDDQPVEEEPEVGDGRAEVRADEAVGAVAADDPTRTHGLAVPIRARDGQLDPRRIRSEVDDLAAASHPYRRKGLRAGVEDAFQVRLREHARVGPAGQSHASAPDPEERLAGGVSPLVHEGRFGEPG